MWVCSWSQIVGRLNTQGNFSPMSGILSKMSKQQGAGWASLYLPLLLFPSLFLSLCFSLISLHNYHELSSRKVTLCGQPSYLVPSFPENEHSTQSIWKLQDFLWQSLGSHAGSFTQKSSDQKQVTRPAKIHGEETTLWQETWSVHSLSRVTSWTAEHQASLSINNSRILLKLMSIKLVMPSNHLILITDFSSCFNLSQHQGLFKWVSSLHQVAKEFELQFQHKSFQWRFRIDFLYDWLVWSPCSPRDSQESSSTPQFKSINSLVLSFIYGPTLTSTHDYWKSHSFD